MSKKNIYYFGIFNLYLPLLKCAKFFRIGYL